jgi:hypothetical protein
MPTVCKNYKHLIKIISVSKEHHPNFTIFLGAGASRNSGVKTASEMIWEWRKDYKEIYD